MSELNLSFRKALDTENDYISLYRIKSDPENIKWGGWLQPPEKNQFKSWYQNTLKRTDREIYLVFCDLCKDYAVAYFYVDYVTPSTVEDTKGVLQEYSGLGIGTYIVQVVDRIAFEKGAFKRISWVSEKNIASFKHLPKLGYKRTTEHETRYLPLMGGNHTFIKWEKLLTVK